MKRIPLPVLSPFVRFITIVVAFAAFLNFSPLSTVQAKSAPVCQTGSMENTNRANFGGFNVQPGDTVVARASISNGTSISVSIYFNGSIISGSSATGTATAGWTATGAGSVHGSFRTRRRLRGTWVVTWSLSLNGGCQTPKLYNFMDGRCNQEPWQSFAVYPDGKDGWIFYSLYQGVGNYAMHVTKAFMDANPDTGVNHIIAQSDGVQLWRLQGGLLQVHRIGLNGKDYSFNLDHCDGAPAPNYPAPVPNTY